MPSTAVFLGPSLDPQEARKVLDARYHPPVRRGDVRRCLVRDAPAAIGIVDGQFFQSFSISPKEILVALDAGVRVYGSSSMGVLRAVELAPYGMKGIGKIFDLFARGQLDADDEVAMVYDEGSLRALSVPLVNMRFALQRAREQGTISEQTERCFIDKAKRLHYPERTYRRVLNLLQGSLPRDELIRLERFLDSAVPDTKREDALEMLAVMKDEMTGP